MDCVDAIELTERFVNKLIELSNDSATTDDVTKGTLVGLSRVFSTMTPDEKNCVMLWLVGRLIKDDING